ncbi:hypothetical protein J6590_104412, partial [Homalodisca vitripennis]
CSINSVNWTSQLSDINVGYNDSAHYTNPLESQYLVSSPLKAGHSQVTPQLTD